MAFKHSFCLLALMLLLACSSWQVANSPPINEVPQLSILQDMDWQVMGRNRQPAGQVSKADRPYTSKLSNKRVYFQTLFEQFQKLRALRPSFPHEIRHCPSFHNTFLTLLQRSSPNTSPMPIPETLQEFITTEKPETVTALFPELALPVAHASGAPTVYQAFVRRPHSNLQQVLTRGLIIHTEKTHRELQRLCSTGHSQNYFIFENMIRHTQNHPQFKNASRPLLSLLKTSVFANHALLQSLTAFHARPTNTPLSEGEAEMMARLNAHWSLGYFQQLRQRRLQFLRKEVSSYKHDNS